jgi:hypothetical protein
MAVTAPEPKELGRALRGLTLGAVLGILLIAATRRGARPAP